MAIIISIGKWGGVWAYKGYGIRVCLGWVAISFFPIDGDNIIDYASKWAVHLTQLAPNRGCRHAQSGYQVNPDDGSVWCFSCNPPRQVS